MDSHYRHPAGRVLAVDLLAINVAEPTIYWNSRVWQLLLTQRVGKQSRVSVSGRGHLLNRTYGSASTLAVYLDFPVAETPL